MLKNLSLNPRELRVYPSPANSQIYFGGIESNGAIVEAEVFNTQGISVLQSSINPADGLPIQDLTAGVYYVRLRDKGGINYMGQFVVGE